MVNGEDTNEMLSILLLLGCMTAEIEAPVFSAGNEELRQYLLEAAQNNPGLKARYLEWQAALEKVPQVTALDDPMLTYVQFLQSDTERFDIALEQRFPWFGTLRARGDKALVEADAALSRFYSARNQLFAEVKRAYFEYMFLGQSIKIVQSQSEVLADVEELVKSRYALGLAAQSDLYRVQIEKDKLDDMLKGLLQSRPALSAKLQETLGREVGDELEWPQSVEFPTPPPPPPIVLARIRVVNPDIAAVEHMVKSWEKEGILAKKRGYPEITLGFEYDSMRNLDTINGRMDRAMVGDALKMIFQDGPELGVLPTVSNIAYEYGKERYLQESGDVKDDVMISLRLTLPIWRGKIKAGIKEANLMREAVEKDKQRLTLSLDSAARLTLYNIQDAERRFNLYKEVLIPKEKKTYESIQLSYGVGTDSLNYGGNADFLDLQNSARSLLEFQLEQARAEKDLHVASADLELLMGGPWSDSGIKPLEEKSATPLSPQKETTNLAPK